MTEQAKAAPSAPRRAAATSPVGSRSSTPRAAAGHPPTEEVPAEAERCGHRNMGGKSCTRDAGHSEKNHRYG